ncbi:MAG TPA: DUF2283 domain-containing protein [Promineifilum sp.]|nr:DUF2283 domain-containing protein [Promineifilum sp.]
MIIKYFPDTDTLYVAFADRPIAETVDLNERTLLDLDADGNVVALTLEHARATVDLTDFSFQQLAAIEPASV